MDGECGYLVKAALERHRLTRQQDDQPPGEQANISWPACEDFTVEEGKKHITSYIKTWEIRPCWIYGLDFLSSTEEEYCTFYHYRARFSTPTAKRPIQGTVSVFFAVDVSKVKPGSLPVRVHFVVESNRLVHTPGRTRFREKWLKDVIDNKNLLGEALTWKPPGSSIDYFLSHFPNADLATSLTANKLGTANAFDQLAQTSGKGN